MTSAGAAAMAAMGLITSALAPALLVLLAGHGVWQRIRLPAPAVLAGFVVLHSAITIAMSMRVPFVFMALARPALLAGALLFWLPVLGPPGVRLDGAGTSVYLFLAGPALDLAGVYLVARGDEPGGLAMIVAMLPVGLAAVYLTWRWIAAEERDERAGQPDARRRRVVAGRRGPATPPGSGRRWPVLTRRGLRMVLGLLWLTAACLQAQPWMFTTGFAKAGLAPAAAAQPFWLADAIRIAATVTYAHPALANTAFVVLQAALGLAMLWPRTARTALVVSTGWALAVWVVGEGLGGLLTPMNSVLTGSPGAALLYAVLAVAALGPAPAWRSRRGDDSLPSWLPAAWIALWLVVLLTGPWPGTPGSMPLVAAELAAALGMACARSGRRFAVLTGAGLATFGWVAGQSLGGISTGHATDVGTGPLLVLLAAAAWSAADKPAQDRRGLVPDLTVELVQRQPAVQLGERGAALLTRQSGSGRVRQQECLAEPGRQLAGIRAVVDQKQQLGDGVVD